MIRLARPSDAEAVRAIYAPFVTGSVVSFEQTPPDRTTIEQRIDSTLKAGLPWLVSTVEGHVDGYAYAGLHRSRPAYAWSVETSVYLAPAIHGQGRGTQLMTALLQVLTRQGYRTALAGVSLPNPASVALHRKLGFETIGTYRDVGFKDDRWIDVWWGQRTLSASRAPEAPLPLQALDEPW